MVMGLYCTLPQVIDDVTPSLFQSKRHLEMIVWIRWAIDLKNTNMWLLNMKSGYVSVQAFEKFKVPINIDQNGP